MASDFRDITVFYIEGIKAGYLMKSSYSQANVTLTSINVQDLNTMSIYKNVKQIAQCIIRLFKLFITSTFTDCIGRRFRNFTNPSCDIQHRTRRTRQDEHVSQNNHGVSPYCFSQRICHGRYGNIHTIFRFTKT